LLWDLAAVRRRTRPPPRALPAEEFAKRWEQLASDQPHAALWHLVAAGDDAVAFLRKQVPPFVAPPPHQLAQWLDQLSDRSFAARQKAVGNLERLGELAEPALRAYLAGKPALEGTRRAESLLLKVE